MELLYYLNMGLFFFIFEWVDNEYKVPVALLNWNLFLSAANGQKTLIITWVVVVALDASLYTSALHFGLHFLGTRLSSSSGLNLSAHLGPGLVQSTHCYTAILTDLENDFYRSRKQSIFI